MMNQCRSGLKREATTAAIKQEILKTVAERPDLEQAHNFYANIRTIRSPESIHASRMVEIINKWRERGVVERWSRQAAMAAGGQMFNARWVYEQHKEKSRCVVKDFANTRDPTMFAAASDTAVGRVVEFKAVTQNYSMFHVRCDVGVHTCLGRRTCLFGTAIGGDRGTW